MGHLLIVAVCVASCITGSLACAWTPKEPQNQKGAVDTLNEILDEAKERDGTGTMSLQGYGRGPSPRSSLPVLPTRVQIIRAPEGGTLLVHCNNTNGAQVNQTEIPPAYRYNGKLVSLADPTLASTKSEEFIYCCNGQKTSHHDIIKRNSWRVSEYQRDTGAFSIVLEDFNDGHSGVYECLHSNGSQLVVTQRYWVTPILTTLTRDNVFHPPMQNLTVRYGDYAALDCIVRFSFLPGRLIDRFLWRSGHQLLMANSMPEVADKIPAWDGWNGRLIHYGSDGQMRCRSTLTINSVTWEDAGRYECWFRIDDRLDGWIMQEVRLRVV